MEWIVDSKSQGTKLVAFLKEKLGEKYSSRELKRSIESNLCLVDGKVERFASLFLKTGQKIVFRDQQVDTLPPAMFRREKSRVIYEDDQIFVYNKPVGITSDEVGLAALFSNFYSVHRLDKETSGVIIFAKTVESEEYLKVLFHDRKVEKTYLALVDGKPKESEGYIENYLGRLCNIGEYAIWGVVRPPRGRLAQTSWTCLRTCDEAALIECRPKTGRTHQIRLHMLEMGHPILGDYRYSKKYKCTYHAVRCLLHAHRLSFVHPKTGELVTYEAPIPEDMEKAIKAIFS